MRRIWKYGLLYQEWSSHSVGFEMKEMKEFGTKALTTVEKALPEMDGLLISKLEIKCRNEITLQQLKCYKLGMVIIELEKLGYHTRPDTIQ